MDASQRLLVAVLAGLISVAVVITAVIWTVSAPLPAPLPPTEPLPRVATTQSRPQVVSIRSGEVLAFRNRIAELEGKLAQRDRVVQDRTKLLAELHDDLTRLREQLDQAGQMAEFQLDLSMIPPAAQNPPAATNPQEPFDPESDASLAELGEMPDMPELADMPELEDMPDIGDMPETSDPATAERRLEDALRRAELAEADLRAVLRIRRRGMQFLGSAAVGGLIEALGSQDVQVRRWACDALGDLGLDASTAAEALNRLAVADTDAEVRIRAALALSRVRD